MTIQRRLQVGAGILVLFILGTVWLLYWSSRQVDKGIRATETISQVTRSAYSLVVLLDEYHDYGVNRALEQWERNRDSLGQLVNKLDSESPSFAPELQQTLRNTLKAVNSLSPQAPRMTSSRVSGGEPQDEKSKDMLSSLMFLRLEDLLRTANDLSEVVQSATLRQRRFVEVIIVGAGISLFVLLLINIYAVRNLIVNPLAALSAGADRIGEGQFDYVAETKRDDEVGKLAQAFNAMIKAIQQRATTLKISEERLRLAQSSANVGVWEWHLSSAKVFWTEELERLYGYAEGTFPRDVPSFQRASTAGRSGKNGAPVEGGGESIAAL